MKFTRKKLLVLIPVCVLIFCAICIASVFISIEIRYNIEEKKVAQVESEYKEDLYYFNQLTYKEQLLFKAIQKAADNYHNETDILPYLFSEKEFQRVAKAILFDCPELFYLDNDSLELYSDSYKSLVKMNFLASNTNIKNMKMEIEAVCAAALAYTNKDQTDFEKALALHDFLTRHCTYAGKSKTTLEIPKTSHTAYGALIDKFAYCDGYSAAYKILLNRCGIECITLEGKTDIEPHLWNIVKQNGKYYHIDCTWNDPDVDFLEDFTFHGFFNVSDSDISKSHLIYREFDLPVCDTTENYYSMIGAKVVSPEKFEDIAYNQIKKAVDNKLSYFEIYPIYTNNEDDYKDSLLKAIDRVNSEQEKSILSRSYQTYIATEDGYAVTVEIYYINQ